MFYDTFSKEPASKIPSDRRIRAFSVYYVAGEGKVNEKERPGRIPQLRSL